MMEKNKMEKTLDEAFETLILSGTACMIVEFCIMAICLCFGASTGRDFGAAPILGIIGLILLLSASVCWISARIAEAIGRKSTSSDFFRNPYEGRR